MEGKRTLVQYLYGNRNGDTRVLLWVNGVIMALTLALRFGR